MDDFRYQDVERGLAAVYGVEAEHRKTFRARIRHLRNEGVPDFGKVGSGRHLTYTSDHLHEMYIGLELLAANWTPAVIGDFVERSRDNIWKVCRWAVEQPDISFGIAVSTRPTRLPPGKTQTAIVAWFLRMDDVLDHVGKHLRGDMRRVTILAISKPLQELHRHLDG